MDAFINEIGAFIRANGMWAGPIVGLLAFGESLVLVGLLIPATALLMVMGSLIGGGVLHPVPVIAGAIIGAALGDIVSYCMGRAFGSKIIYRWPLNRYRGAVTRARLYFWKYSFAAVFFGRFIGPLRCTVPLVAGMRGMNPKRFQIANIASAIVWAPVIMLPGYLAAIGATWLGVDGEGNMALMTGIVLAVSIVFALIILRLMSRSGRDRHRPRPG